MFNWLFIMNEPKNNIHTYIHPLIQTFPFKWKKQKVRFKSFLFLLYGALKLLIKKLKTFQARKRSIILEWPVLPVLPKEITLGIRNFALYAE